MRIAVKRAARDGEAGFFDVKAFGAQAVARAAYLTRGREVAIEARLRFEEFETKAGGYAQRVYLIADQVEFLASRRPSDQPDDNGQPDQDDRQPGESAEPSPSERRPNSNEPTRRPAAKPGRGPQRGTPEPPP